MTRLRSNPLLFWLLMLCLGLQGIGSAVHRISHNTPCDVHGARIGSQAATHNEPVQTAIAESAANSDADRAAKSSGQTSSLEKSDKGAAQTAELCLLCANLSAAKSLSPTFGWLANTTYREHRGEGYRFREINNERRLFAPARAPPIDLS